MSASRIPMRMRLRAGKSCGKPREVLTAFVRGDWAAVRVHALDKLPDEQRIAPRLCVDLGQDIVADTCTGKHGVHQLIGGLPGQAMQVDSEPETLSRHRLDHLPEASVGLDIRVSQRPDHEQRRADGQMGQVPDQIEADGISLVQVAEDQKDRLRASQVHQELDNGREEIEIVIAQIGRLSRERDPGPQRRHEPCQARVCARDFRALGL